MPALTMSRRLRAAPAAVFQALTEPARIAQWFGSGTPESKDVEADARVGGRYHYGFTSLNGQRMDVRGVFEEVTPHSRLVFSWWWDSSPEQVSKVEIDLAADGEGTMLNLVHSGFATVEAEQGHREGWTYGLDRLAAAVETVAA
jgi:uncharacterized protein YndB with AHSA1/START domain